MTVGVICLPACHQNAISTVDVNVTVSRDHRNVHRDLDQGHTLREVRGRDLCRVAIVLRRLPLRRFDPPTVVGEFESVLYVIHLDANIWVFAYMNVIFPSLGSFHALASAHPRWPRLQMRSGPIRMRIWRSWTSSLLSCVRSVKWNISFNSNK